MKKYKNYTCLFFLFLLSIFYSRRDIFKMMILTNIYFFIDYFIPPLRSDMLIHHLNSQILITTAMYYREQIPYFVFSTIFNTEISTFFLIFNDLGIYRYLNIFLFVITFFYYRIYQLGFLLWTYPFYQFHILITISLLLLYGLNLFWFLKILKMIYKHIF